MKYRVEKERERQTLGHDGDGDGGRSTSDISARSGAAVAMETGPNLRKIQRKNHDGEQTVSHDSDSDGGRGTSDVSEMPEGATEQFLRDKIISPMFGNIFGE